MASSVNSPRGMRDFLPAEKAKRERVLGTIRQRYAAHGFDEIETPVVEDYARLHSGLGGDNEKLSFSVLKRGLTGEALHAAAEAEDVSSLADLGLRFDLTVPLARFYASHRAELPTVFRSVQIAPVWRAERPQKGRYRQFVQCDIDIIGEAGLLAEIELITATLDVLDALNLTGCTVRINDRRVLIALLDHFGFAEADHAKALITIDKLDKIGAAGVIAELRSFELATSEGLTALEAYLGEATAEKAATPFSKDSILAALPEGISTDAIENLASIGAAVDANSLVFDPFLVRGMGYYTGTIFEILHPDFSFSLGGGGRYDGMIGRFLGTEVPAVGFSIGFERIIDLIQLSHDSDQSDLALVYEKHHEPAQLQAIKSELIQLGHRVRLEKKAKNFKGQLDRLTQAGVNSFAQLGQATTAGDLEIRSLS